MSEPDKYLLNVSSPQVLEGIITDDMREALEFVVDGWISSFISYFGLINNLICIMVFAKMGFAQTINISLSLIAVFDFTKCLVCAIVRLYCPIRLFSEVLAINWNAYSRFYLQLLFSIFGYVSSFMAAYVSVERCLCVSLPFTVKYLLTHRVVIGVNITITVMIVGVYSVGHKLVNLVVVFSPKYNQTITVIVASSALLKEPWLLVYNHSIGKIGVVVPLVVMSICTAIIFYHLRKSTMVRSVLQPLSTTETTTKSESSSITLSIRDKQVMKMLMVVILVYIVCNIPRLVSFMAIAAVPELDILGRYKNMLNLLVYLFFIFDLINASVNVFIYFLMNSQFKSTFLDIFYKRCRQKV